MRKLVQFAVSAFHRTPFLILALWPSLTLAGQSSPPLLRLSQTFKVNGAATNLSPISWIAVSAKGVVAVLQPEDHKVLFYGATGKRIGEFGRSGEGPGEFRLTGEIGWVGDTLWVRDLGRRRLNFITPQLRLLREVPYTDIAPEEGAPDPSCVGTARGSKAVNPFCAHTLIRPADDSSVTAIVTQSNRDSRSGRFTVSLVRKRGDTVFSGVHSTTPLPADAKTVDALLGRFGSRLPPETAAFLRSTMPDYLPPIEIVRVGRDGTIWLRLNAIATAPTIHYLIIGPGGREIGTAILPRRVTIHAVSKDRVWGVETDENGVDSVVAYSVRP